MNQNNRLSLVQGTMQSQFDCCSERDKREFISRNIKWATDAALAIETDRRDRIRIDEAHKRLAIFNERQTSIDFGDMPGDQTKLEL